jgi:hypothetical protein
MPWYRVNGIAMHLKLSGRAAKNPPAPCRAFILGDGSSSMRCCGISLFLCDFKLLTGGTCDMPLCSEHATEVGRDTHLCPEHAPRRAELAGDQPGLFG